MNPLLQHEFDQLSARSEWLASFTIDGETIGAGFNHDHDVRPGQFFSLVPQARRILELGSCQGGGTFQLASRAGVEEVVAIEGRDYNIEKARFAQELLGLANVTFIEANLETFDFKSLGPFDAVYCVGLLYHLPKPWELLTRLKEVSDAIYLNTHYCRARCASRKVGAYEGANWHEMGFHDPLSGLSNWSFWPTLKSLTEMLADAGFLSQIVETDSTGLGQCPHGTTILARQAAAISGDEKDRLLLGMRAVLSALPPQHGSKLRGPLATRVAQSIAQLRRASRRLSTRGPQRTEASQGASSGAFVGTIVTGAEVVTGAETEMPAKSHDRSQTTVPSSRHSEDARTVAGSVRA
jgi:SAM-dependent methyltransferase